MSGSGAITTADILDLVQYERQRVDIRRRVMAMRKLRRVHVGPVVTVHFENVDTVKYQIQEMCRIERIVDPERIQDEIDAYTDLLPMAGNLGATVMIELNGEALLREWLPKLVGVEHTFRLEVEGTPDSAAAGDEGRSTDEITSAVHYLRFPVGAAQLAAMRDGAAVRIAIGHEKYHHAGEVTPELAAALVADLDSVT